MALLLVLSALCAIVIYHLFNGYRNLTRNIAIAKSSGLRVVVLPVYVNSVVWLATNIVWLPLLAKLPASCKGVWFDLLDPEWSYRLGYKPFRDLGTDVFVVASPSRISAFVADAEVVTQITTRRNDFPKPLHLYTRLNIYGRNVVATEGTEWRMHRKLTAPSFGEKNNELVFVESIHHARCLVRLWTGPDGCGEDTIKDPALDTMRFALYVISRAGFGVRVAWPHEEEEHGEVETTEAASMFGSQVPEGHKMNYREALGSLLENIMWTQMAPPEYLTKSPFKIHRTVGTAVIEWGNYMDELFDAKKEEIASGRSTDGMDLFGTLIRGSGILDEKTTDLERSDILGNAFVIMLAGHETTANVLHFSLLFLAMNTQSQKRMHEDIEKTLGTKNPSDWSYDDDFPRLFNGMPAAVMNETLRLLQPVINILKSTTAGRPQEFHMDGQQYTFPGDIDVSLSGGIHRNPKYWPAPPDYESTDGLPDIDHFRPERWLVDAKPTEAFEDIKYDDEDLRGPSGEDTSSHLFKPVKGSYIPFSDGYRSCIGRRFAQVEILAAFAVIFSQYSVELAVDEFATDEEIEKMPVGGKERKAVWQKARDRADHLLMKTMGSIITLQLRGTTIPIRLVKKGRERFLFE
ncbi:cytochrome P450 monooxygenase-like protein [Pleomassaria siparia CBS 279.74]|uniref:Cytochrome P450 monooxygenase-like protein n=1 Tax=Pleomassaria siparia CBS 279.74 TaxID=1314801 RepID=A0A6G1KFD4_9PLEO|nr:cytochrome P450 monooxygenase-like protein [Pleomassaria siparia CBS 279.74]